jgi:DNA-binding NtrC family response regulator
MIAERHRVLAMLHENKINVEEAEELLDTLEQTVKQEPELDVEIITANPQLQQILELARKAGDSDVPVLIAGESGTGKELVARMIHQNSLRRNGPFVYVNCALSPETLLESELFGHERGAFTGAIHQKTGFFGQASDGTLFFDEIGELPINLQDKILRFIEIGKIRRMGGTSLIHVNVRIIAATNRDLKSEVEAKKFHKDLLDAISIVLLEMPPLRERTEDIPLLVDYFLKKYAKQYNKNISSILPEAVKVLMAYSWPGNARELYNVIQSALVMCRGNTIQVEDLPSAITKDRDKTSSMI